MDRRDPEVDADERTSLTQVLDYHRATLLGKAAGLDAASLDRRLEPSTLTLGGLLKHLALNEDTWFTERFAGAPALAPWDTAPWDEDPDWEFSTARYDEPDALRDLYRAACERSRAVVAAAPGPRRPVGVGRSRGPPLVAAGHPAPPHRGDGAAQRPRRPAPPGHRRVDGRVAAPTTAPKARWSAHCGACGRARTVG